MKIRINTSNNATAVNIKERWSENINVFKMSESENFVSIVYDTNACYCKDDIPTNSIVSIDMKKDLLDASTMLVKEWTIQGSVPCANDYSVIVDVMTAPCVF